MAWALLAGCARRLAPPHLQGRAVAVAMTGIPVALSLGVPAGTFLGAAVGWRAAFTAMTVIAVGLLGWIALAVPDLPGERGGGRAPVARTLRVPGVLPVLAVTFALVLVAAGLWGPGWGGAPTLLQTAVADSGGDAADTAQTMLVSLWNAAMAAGGLAGGLLLDVPGAGVLPWSVLLLLVPVVAVVTGARAHDFPAAKAP
ncbi:hypothetical protein ACWFR1_26010 [Streptomyces sp. NPDC055103]